MSDVAATAQFWSVDADRVLSELRSTPDGLSSAEAQHRLQVHGANRVAPPRSHRGWRLFVAQVTSPIMLILAAATVVSMSLGDVADGSIILGIIVASAVLGFWQEHSAGRAVDALLAQVRVHVEVMRDGNEVAVPIDDVVPATSCRPTVSCSNRERCWSTKRH